MADQYATVIGFVQFPVEERELPSGQSVRDVTIRPFGIDMPLVRITVWPEFAGTEVQEGDLVAADGKYEERTAQNKEGQNRTYRNLNPQKLAVLASAPKAEREVVNKRKGSF